MSDHSIEEELVNTTIIEDVMIQNNQKIVQNNFEVCKLNIFRCNKNQKNTKINLRK